MWAFECGMNMEKYEYQRIPPATNGIGNFMRREMFFPKIIILFFQRIV